MKLSMVVLALVGFVSLGMADEPVEKSDEKSTGSAESAALSSSPKGKTYTGEALAIQTRLDELFDASRKVNGEDKQTARAAIENSLDWEKISQACLGNRQWKKQPKKNRDDFQGLLKDVVVRTAYTRMDKFWGSTSYQFDKIDVKGKEAHVVAKFNASGDILILEYYLTKRGTTWLIHDISFEDNRYSTNINEQITAFLREKPFGQLLTSLKKRKAELDAEKPKAKSSAEKDSKNEEG